MTLSITQVMHAISRFTVGPDGDVNSERLDILTILATNRLNTIIGSRSFSADELTELTALIICDMLQNEHGKGTVTQEAVTDSSYQVNIKTSSRWMDEVYTKCAEYDNNNQMNSTSDYASADGVLRDDSYPSSITDGYVFPHHYGG